MSGTELGHRATRRNGETGSLAEQARGEGEAEEEEEGGEREEGPGGTFERRAELREDGEDALVQRGEGHAPLFVPFDRMGEIMEEARRMGGDVGGEGGGGEGGGGGGEKRGGKEEGEGRGSALRK
eukprot:298567-Rhodomonas_salina.4